MTTFIPVDYFSHGTFSPLQKAIINRTDYGYINYKSYGGPEVTAPLQSLSRAVESAFVLVEKAALPKITSSPTTMAKRMFYFAGDPYVPYSTDPNHTAERARKTAANWLAIAGLLEAEEKKAADEAKAKADAEKAKVEARLKRLDELADEHFEEYFEDLGPKKTSAIEEIYRLEQEVKERTPYDERDAA